MGTSKLLLPWPVSDGPSQVMIDAVLEAWTSSRVARVVVVVRQDDLDLRRRCEKWPVHVVCPPVDPRDMKASVLYGWQALSEAGEIKGDTRCFVAPADLPHISAELIDRLIDEPALPHEIVLPRFGEHPGHPILLPVEQFEQLKRLADDEGLDRIIERSDRCFVHRPEIERIKDVDTPEEYISARKNDSRGSRQTPP